MARTKGTKNKPPIPPKEVLIPEDEKLAILADLLLELVAEEMKCQTP